MNKLLVISLIIAVVLGAIVFVLQQPTTAPATGSPPIVSSTTPPTPTPTPSAKGTITGRVLLGPTCPVERIPPDPQCADKPYQTTIHIQPTNPSAPYQTVSTDSSGAFSISLDPGTYTFIPQGGASMLPACHEQQVVVTSGQTQNINLNCDTGIR